MYLAPAARPPALPMLDQQVAGADLAAAGVAVQAARVRGQLALAVVLGHVRLELLGVGARGRLPARLLLCLVEVVGQVLGVGVADLPPGRQPRVGLRADVSRQQGRRGGGRRSAVRDGNIPSCAVRRTKS